MMKNVNDLRLSFSLFYAIWNLPKILIDICFDGEKNKKKKKEKITITKSLSRS